MWPTRVVVHCSASPNGKRVDISEIERWHKARGFATVGYHMVINPTGEVQKGRSLTTRGAHCIEANADSIGICLVGTDKFTKEQLDALRYQIDSVCMLYDIARWQVFAHNQFKSAIEQGKTCPGFSVNALLGWYLTGDMKALGGHVF